MAYSVAELAQQLGAKLAGDGEVRLHGFASLEAATPQDLSFVEREEDMERALASNAGALIAGSFIAKASPATLAGGKPLLIAAQPRLAFARAARMIRPTEPAAGGVHAAAVVDSTARIAAGASVEAKAVVCGGAILGEGVRIGAGAYVGAGVRIGRDSTVHPNVVIYPDTRLGERVVVHAGAVLGSDGFGYVRDRETGRHEQFPQAGTLEIGDDVEIGANTTVDRGSLEATVIGRGCKLDNLIHIGHNVRLGENVIIAAQTGISGSVVIEDNVVMGGQVGIGDHARVETGTILGGQCGVLNGKILRGKGMLFWGTPARPVREYLKQIAALSRLAKR